MQYFAFLRGCLPELRTAKYCKRSHGYPTDIHGRSARRAHLLTCRSATPFTICFAQCKKGTMGENSADEPKLLGRLTDKLVDRLDINKLSDSVADQICERVASNFKTSDLVDRLLDNYHERIQAAIAEAIIQRLFPVS